MTFTFLDFLTVAIIGLLAFFGYKKGILKTVISVIGTLLASLMSAVLSKPIAQAIYNGGFKSAIISKADKAMQLAKQEGQNYVDSFLKSMPSFVQNSLSGFKLSEGDISRASQNGSAQIERLLQPLIVSFLTVIVATVLFVVLMLLVRVICTLIYRTMDETPLNVFDGLVGGVIGIFEGFVIVIIVAFIIRIAVPHMKTVPDFISNENISQSTVFKGVYNSPILTKFVSSVTDSPNTSTVE